MEIKRLYYDRQKHLNLIAQTNHVSANIINRFVPQITAGYVDSFTVNFGSSTNISFCKDGNTITVGLWVIGVFLFWEGDEYAN